MFYGDRESFLVILILSAQLLLKRPALLYRQGGTSHFYTETIFTIDRKQVLKHISKSQSKTQLGRFQIMLEIKLNFSFNIFFSWLRYRMTLLRVSRCSILLIDYRKGPDRRDSQIIAVEVFHNEEISEIINGNISHIFPSISSMFLPNTKYCF